MSHRASPPSVLVVLCLAAVPLVAQQPPQKAAKAAKPAASEQKPDDAGLEHLTYAERRFQSEALGKEVEYGVFVPKDYDAKENAETRYPLVVWLHGLWEDHDRFEERGGAPILDEMVGDGRMPKCVFVCAEGDRSSFWTNGEGEGRAYEDMVAKDLLKEVESQFRIEPGRASRALMGVSMGGYGALKIAFKEPEKFGIVAAHSAAILPRDPAKLEAEFPWVRGRAKALVAQVFGDPLDVEKWRRENVLVLAEEQPKEQLSSLAIYFDCGDQDRYRFQVQNAKLHEILEKRGVAHTWRLVAGGEHGWRSGYNQAQLPHSLEFVAGQFALERGRAGLQGLMAPHEKSH